MILDSLETRKAAAQQLGRIKVETMSAAELDLASALLLHLDIRVDDKESAPWVRLPADSDWREFSPLTCAQDLIHVMSNTEVVFSSHKKYGDDDKVIGHWYSAHAFYGGTEHNGMDMPTVVCTALASLLAHNVEFGEEWGNA